MLVVFSRTLILYFLVVITLRIMGKPQIGELQPFELVIAIMISELAAVPMADTEIPLLNGIIPILTLMFIQISLSYIALKSNRAREIICGKPSILIENGKIKEDELRRLRMNINDLLEQLRVAGYPDIAEVNYAILETNGDLSVIPKALYRPVQLIDLGLTHIESELPLSLIIDGRVVYKNLSKAGLSLEELIRYFMNQGVTNLQDVFFAGIDQEGNITWQLKEGVQSNET
ncbi:MAG: DUF421 domain-containing protein [Peptococcia bacterium]